MKKLPAQQVSGLVHVLVCLSVRPSVSLSVCLSPCPSVCLFRCLTVRLSISLSPYLSVSLSICLSVLLSISLSVCLCQSICLSICMSVCLSFPSVCLYVKHLIDLSSQAANHDLLFAVMNWLRWLLLFFFKHFITYLLSISFSPNFQVKSSLSSKVLLNFGKYSKFEIQCNYVQEKLYKCM